MDKKKVVNVVFAGNPKRYAYFTNLNLTYGDVVVVNALNGYAIAKVLGMSVDADKATKWVVCDITRDIIKHRDRLRKEEEKSKKAEIILAEIDKLRQEYHLLVGDDL